MKNLIIAIRMKIFFTLLLGLIYPIAMTGVAQVIFPKQSSGDATTWIGQKFEKPEYFWSRPSAVDYNPLPSGGSNLGPTSSELKKLVDGRRAKLKGAHPEQSTEPPQDLLFASASGLDPHISPEAAKYQAQRIARIRLISVATVLNLIDQVTVTKQFGILGEPTVNVLTLNIALDKYSLEKAKQKTDRE